MALEGASFIEHVGDATAHSRGEIPARAAEHDDHATRHVFAAMVADTFDHGEGAAVSYREALARQAAEIGLSRRRAIEHGVAYDHRLVRQEERSFRRSYDEPAAGESLAHIVIRLTFQLERESARRKRAEALPGRADEPEDDALVRQANVAVAPSNLPRASLPRHDPPCEWGAWPSPVRLDRVRDAPAR